MGRTAAAGFWCRRTGHGAGETADSGQGRLTRLKLRQLAQFPETAAELMKVSRRLTQRPAAIKNDPDLAPAVKRGHVTVPTPTGSGPVSTPGSTRRVAELPCLSYDLPRLGCVGQEQLLLPIVRLAASTGVKAPIRFYLRSGRNPNATDSRSRTLLLLAATAGHTDICRLLIESGADPTLRDADGNDALSAAIKNRHAEVAGVLRACLARPASPPAPTTDQARTDGDSSSIGSLPNNVASDPGGDDWEAEPVASPPPDDETLRRSTSELQNGISAHAPIDADHAWEDVEIDLPESAARPDPAHAVWLDEVRSLIHYGLSWGWVTRHQVVEVAGRNGAADGRDEVEISLRLVLGEVGIVVDEAVGESTTGQLWRDWQGEPPSEDGHSGVIDEAVAFLEASGLLENPLNCYWRDIRRLEAESSRRLRASPAGSTPRSRRHMNSR